MNESITSVAKKEQRMADAPAAIYVLTGDEILRAGYSSIPEALRMVPGLSVAQLDSQHWIVTARGFAAQWAGKLLVLIDGRSVYDPFFSGVLWSRQDLLLENLDRIEVIRGPGAALWGANAVNGVINIITKNSAQTQGTFAVGSWGGNKSYGAMQWGGEVGDAHYRVYVKYDDYARLATGAGAGAGDPWRMWRGGFRTDWRTSEADRLTVQGDLYDGKLQVTDGVTALTAPYMSRVPFDQGVSGGHLLGHWQHTADQRSQWSLQAYYDRTEQRDRMLGIRRDTFDIEFQHQQELGSRQTVVYGAGYRYTQADYTDSYFLSYAHAHDSSQLLNVFGQDEISVVPDRVKLVLGSKFEHNEFTGFETQPSARVMWTPDHTHSLWASVSRAVRTPNFDERGLRINFAAFDPDGPGPALPRVLSILPNPALQSEKVLAYELGYRAQTARSLFVDVATFFNVYQDLISAEDSSAFVETNPPPAHLAITTRNVNTMHASTYGVEIAPTWQLTDWWKVAAGYTWLHMNLHSDVSAQASEGQAGDSPQHQAQMRSSMRLLHRLTLDTAVYYVDKLPNQGIASYTRLDAFVGWMATEQLNLSLGGTNLLDGQHAEFRSYAVLPVETKRSLYAKVAWRF